jgi:hypothetical protein
LQKPPAEGLRLSPTGAGGGLHDHPGSSSRDCSHGFSFTQDNVSCYGITRARPISRVSQGGSATAQSRQSVTESGPASFAASGCRKRGFCWRLTIRRTNQRETEGSKETAKARAPSAPRWAIQTGPPDRPCPQRWLFANEARRGVRVARARIAHRLRIGAGGALHDDRLCREPGFWFVAGLRAPVALARDRRQASRRRRRRVGSNGVPCRGP